MKTFFKVLVASVLAVFVVSSLTACTTASTLDMKTVSAVIDVRTPEEFATGHLQGALNINFEGASFVSEIQALDHSVNYVLYCRSGNRAGQVLDYMTSNGFTGNITNAGSVADAAAATGLSVVQ